MTAEIPQRALLRHLVGSRVELVLIGGMAVAAHGYVRATEDIDVVYSTDLESCTRLAAALVELRAEVAFADQPAPGGEIAAEWLAAGGHFRFATESGPLDALSSVAGLAYEQLFAQAVIVRMDDLEVPVCSYEDLVAMKSASGRPRDDADLAELRRIRGD
jgi:Nucleotidyl transferase AbiEii toxin, Type IV TA system